MSVSVVLDIKAIAKCCSQIININQGKNKVSKNKDIY